MYRYVSTVGKPDRADAEYPVLIEKDMAVGPKEVKTPQRSKEATIKFDKADWKTLPTLHHIVETLAGLPIDGIVRAMAPTMQPVPYSTSSWTILGG